MLLLWRSRFPGACGGEDTNLSPVYCRRYATGPEPRVKLRRSGQHASGHAAGAWLCSARAAAPLLRRPCPAAGEASPCPPVPCYETSVSYKHRERKGEEKKNTRTHKNSPTTLENKSSLSARIPLLLFFKAFIRRPAGTEGQLIIKSTMCFW